MLDVDKVDNLIKFCPTKEEMDMLRVSSSSAYAHGSRCLERFIGILVIYLPCYTWPYVLQNFAGDKDTLGKCEQVHNQLSSCAQYIGL